jgi:adhesin transport system membrane fusion protein
MPLPADRPSDPRGWRKALSRFTDLFGAEVKDVEFMRETTAVMVAGPGRQLHWILWSAVLFFIAALIWAAVAEIDQIVTAQGKVIPSSQVQVVSNLEGGIVSQVLVAVGDRVDKDQVLMVLDATRFTSTFREGSAKDEALQARIARLSAEAAGKPFKPPAALAKGSPKVVADEDAVFRTRRQSLESSLQVFREQLTQRTQELEEMRSKEREFQTSYKLAARELEMTRPLVAQGAASEVELLRLERGGNELKGALDAARLAQPRLESAISEARGKIASAEAQFRSDAAKELSVLRGEQAAVSAANVGLEDRLTRTQLRAPMAGIIKTIKVGTVGGVVQPGIDVIEIVPVEDSLLIEARVKPSDIAFLRLGQEGSVKLSAYDYAIYGGLEGKLERIGADTVVLERPNERPEAYYLVRVRTGSNQLRTLAEPIEILPGMEATVDIRTNKRTVLQYLMKPIIKTKERALREH